MGTDSIEESGVGLNIKFDMYLTTESVDLDGTGHLRLDFDDVVMTGQFMGQPVELYHNKERTQMDMGGRDSVDTALGQSVEGIPQIAFFDNPINLTVDRDGMVTST
jgi:hypothetical protein